jgi:hypothetical protein
LYVLLYVMVVHIATAARLHRPNSTCTSITRSNTAHSAYPHPHQQRIKHGSPDARQRFQMKDVRSRLPDHHFLLADAGLRVLIVPRMLAMGPPLGAMLEPCSCTRASAAGINGWQSCQGCQAGQRHCSADSVPAQQPAGQHSCESAHLGARPVAHVHPRASRGLLVIMLQIRIR